MHLRIGMPVSEHLWHRVCVHREVGLNQTADSDPVIRSLGQDSVV